MIDGTKGGNSMRQCRSAAGPVSLGTMILVMLVASISLLLAAKGGSGREGVSSGGSFVQAIVNGQTFTHDLTSNELAEDARDALAALIDAHPDFIANATTVPSGIFELDDVVFEVLTAASSEIDRLFACETDANYTNSAVHISDGRPQALLLKPTAVAGAGTFNVRFDMLIAPDVDQTIITSAGDVSGLINALTSALEGLGFTVTETDAYLVITKLGDKFISNRVETTDTLITHTCVGMSSPASPPSPTPTLPMLHPTGMLLLVTGLLLGGILMIWRKVTT